ncbi:MAG: EipA family protein, partial [Pseudomonadota bacterium]
GLRYGEGTLFTKRHRQRPVYWQGPSLGYDFGAEGSKVMVLVYNLRRPRDIYRRFGGVQGSAYLVGGVSVQLQKADDITLAPIRAGVGLRLGANVGYLKYTRRPTWNPF